MTQANAICRSSRLALNAMIIAVIFWFGAGTAFAQELSEREKKNIDQVKSLITKAGLEFKDEEFKSSAKRVANVQKKLARFAKDATGEYRKQLEQQHERMAKAHKLLVGKGQKLKDVEPLPTDKAGGTPESNSGTSFVKTVAPILNAKCGRCHVANSRGQFSARDYNALMDSTTVTEGDPDVSRLIEVIEDGSMPKGGLSVTETELAALKKWIAEGAKFDGQDMTRPITEFVGAGQSPAPNQNRRNQMAATQKPTGNETVTFGAHVAPILLENCGRCHISRNPRGGFNMASFRSFIRGGDSGAVVVAGNSGASNLIKRLRGDGVEVMPPAGKLDDAVINQVAKWIDEGARFDTDDANLTMQAVAAKGKSEQLSHDELVAFRKNEANRVWKLAMSDTEAEESMSDQFQLKGTKTEEGLDAFATEAESIAASITKHLGTDSRDQFIRGNGTIFVLTRRYDFGEFGKMVLRREFPRQLKAYWNHNGTLAWSAILKSRDKSLEDVRAVMTQQLASLHVADLAPGVPRWFADGLGFCTAAELHRKDSAVLSWEQDAVAAAQSMQRVDDFLMNRMDEDKSGLVSFLFVGKLKSNRVRFNRLMTGLKDGLNFDSAFEDAYGSSAEKIFTGYQGSW